MKKMLAILLCIVMNVGMVACGESEESSATKSKDDVKVEDQTSKRVDKADNDSQNDEVNKDKENMNVEPTLSDLEEYMLAKGVLSGEKSEAYASMIGAEDGFKYLDSNAEFYEYDVNSEQYKNLTPGEEMVTAINGKFVLIMDNGVEDQALLDAFMEFK